MGIEQELAERAAQRKIQRVYGAAILAARGQPLYAHRQDGIQFLHPENGALVERITGGVALLIHRDKRNLFVCLMVDRHGRLGVNVCPECKEDKPRLALYSEDRIDEFWRDAARALIRAGERG